MFTHPLAVQSWLTGSQNDFDAHVLACALALTYCDGSRSLDAGLGLSRDAIAHMVEKRFPHASTIIMARVVGDGDAPACLEEPDLRALLLDHRAGPAPETQWLAHIVARRAQSANHLWQDLGLPRRADLGELMSRHFPSLAAKNNRDMKWKKFFYRELCGLEGLTLCKSPVCDDCTDFHDCFGGEDGVSLLAQTARRDLSPTKESSPC